jgi:hypothetical protein
MAFLAGALPRRPSVQRDVTAWSVDRVLSCQSKMHCSLEGGLQPLPKDMPWTYVLSMELLRPGGGDVPSLLVDVRDQLGAEVVSAVEAVDLLPDPSARAARGPAVAKTVGVLRKRPGQTDDEFANYWRTVHAPITLSYGPKFTGYVSNVVESAAGPFSWDGVVEQTFDTLADLQEHIELAAEGRPRITADIPRFVSEMQMFATEPVTGW